MKRVDLTGKRFGRLVVLPNPRKNGRYLVWDCICDCGKTVSVQGNNLRSGHTKSCGCLQQENRETMNRTHGMSHSRLHNIWTGMKRRCNKPSEPAYPRYGGRGIKVCPEWENSFEAFRDWALANGYRDDLSLDRKENDGNYEPGNCRWATRETQNSNKSSNRIIVFNGEAMTLAQAAKRFGLRRETVANRLNKGWSPEMALTTPVKK